MVSPSGEWVRVSRSSTSPSSAASQTEQAVEPDTEQVFRLIDSILPFEACLYHQILPLTLEGSRLRLGMVNLDDTSALDYVRRILAYMNCSLVPQPMSCDLHHQLLSAYLNYVGKQKKPARKTNSSRNKKSKSPEDKALERDDRSNQPTLVVDSPEELSVLDLDASPTPEVAVEPGISPIAAGFGEKAEVESPPEAKLENAELETLKVELASQAVKVEAEVRPSDLTMFADALPDLEVEANHLSDPVEVLASLPPKVLMQELLARILVDGIGRLYFEQQQNRGRILWSQNGVLQSVLEEVEPALIQAVINELKLLTHLPMLPVEKPRQVEIERLYQKHRLLLRLRIMPNAHGEEATLQVLRGAALKFYQQQQLANLSRDALSIAQQLQVKVNEIRNRTRYNSLLVSDQLDIIPALNQLLKTVDQQLRMLRELQPIGSSEEDR